MIRLDPDRNSGRTGGVRAFGKTRRGALRSGALLGAAMLVFSLGVLQGCSAPEVKEDLPRKSSKPLIWPSPPEPARISYVRSIEKPQDIGVTKGFFTKIVEFIAGAKTEEMIKPYGVTVDSTGRIITVDTPQKRVHIFDPIKHEYTYIEEAGNFPLDTPIAAAVDSQDNIYVTDSAAGNVYSFNSKGKFLKAITGLTRPTGIAIDRQDGTLFVADTGAHNVKALDLKGNPVFVIGKRGENNGEFNYPVDLFVDKNGDLYVNDSMNFRIQIFDKKGAFVTAFGKHGDGSGDFGRPKGIAVDREGHIYVADALFDTVQIFDRKGTFLLNFGSIGREIGTFWLPSGIYIDNGDKIYVADSYNRRVQVFEFLGNF